MTQAAATTVLVVGSAGRIGTLVVRALLAKPSVRVAY
jgi:uncharacterized protein YbjT (DUF2867 family)